MDNRKVMIIGLDGMEPDTTRRMIDAGKMPNVKKLIERGACRKDLHLLGAMPTITPPMWTTLATGCYPATHGVTDFWNPDPVEIETIIYGLDSTLCKAEQLWNVTAEAGKKTLVFHWPGSSWPPTSDSENLFVVDGTQPASVNYSLANCDIEKYAVASTEFSENLFHGFQATGDSAAKAAANCVIDDLEAEQEDDNEEQDWSNVQGKGDQKARDNFMLNRYKMKKAVNLEFHQFEDKGLVTNVPYDKMECSITSPDGWGIELPKGAKEFSIYTSNGGAIKRPCLIIPNKEGKYDTVVIYKTKKSGQVLANMKQGEFVKDVIDEVFDKGTFVKTSRYYRALEIAEDGSKVRLWMSHAYKLDSDEKFSPKSMYHDVVNNVGYVAPMCQMGGDSYEFTKELLVPVWRLNALWQADAINYLIEEKGMEVVFSHHHFIDNSAHQFWNYAMQKEDCPDEKLYQELIDETYENADEYVGKFLHLLDKGWTLILTSDHGEQIHEEPLAKLGSPSGVSIGVMKELGWTVLKKDADGNELPELDLEKTKAVAVRTSYIRLNVKGRNPHGIIDPADIEKVSQEIIDSLYAYRDEYGRRIIAAAFTNRDAVVLGLDGPYTGDIIIFPRENMVSEHGQGLPTYKGYYDTSVSPIFIAAGNGIIHNDDVQRVIRQVDVAPTMALLLGVRMPKQCEGAPVYQILEQCQ